MALQNNPNATPMPAREELVIALLTEELKSRRFFTGVAELGMDNPHFRPSLDQLILSLIGLNDDRNETMDFFCRVMDEHSIAIGIKNESVIVQAKFAYQKLTDYRVNAK